ncbi:ATPase domain-containing protein [Jidongwangia harbinensis]|uniref:ATPase domain-containing protein n=1 Tax=Jidongwangia harbinensis TaxID=2878561 RepID=UPI001CD992B1|nr:ATPase domain-containing protein [Jidongwangia harbinensis]MCA2214170.1 AAA family ATPase [Jidongwangia harbinensis]
MNRLGTGIPGLDVVLNGGLEPGSVTVLAGAPGTGKTILAQQMCFANATAERRAAYYTTLSEPHSKLVRHLTSFTFFAPEVLGSQVEYLHLGDLIRDDQPGGMCALVDEITRKALDEQPGVMVIDSAKALRDFTGERELRMAFYDLTSRLAHTDTALVLVGEYTPAEMAAGVEFSLADAIVHLAYEPREPIDRRWLRVVKMRGTHHLEGKHTFRIGPDGFEVFPRIETVDAGVAAPITGRISSGIPGLDELMAGGIGAGEATVVLGPSGVGKTICGLRFITQGVIQGERCLYVTFQDTGDQLVKMAAAFGWDLLTASEKAQLVVLHVPLGELDLDLLAARIRETLAAGRIHRVVIDSLAEMVFAARESDRFPAYARSLTGLIRAAGATLLITSETTTLGPSPEPIGGVAVLFHNVILLRYIELDSTTGRALNVVKMRNSDHSKDVHCFTIDVGGLSVDRRLDDVTGVLGWSALRSPVELAGTSARRS